MSGEIDPPKMDTDPIDADFEPAPPKADFVEAPEAERKSPGWLALGVTGVLAAIVGGGVGGAISGGGGDYAPLTLVEDVALMGEGQAEFENALAIVAGDIKQSETRLKRQIDAAAAGSGDEDAIDALAEQLSAINAQLEAIDVAEQEAGETEGLQLDQVLARIETLEKIDEDEVASPRVANRAIRSMQRRVDELEEELATRNDALLDLVSRLEAAEAALEAREETGANEETLEETLAGLEVNSKAITALEETVGELAAREPLTSIDSEEQERLTRWVEELREKEAVSRSLLEERGAGQTAIVSLLSIEDAAGDGRGFQTAFAQLEKALPGNRSVAKLKPLAVKGAATMATLQRDFDAAQREAGKLIEAAEKGDGGNSWGWVQRALGDAVTVRRSGEPEPVETGSVQGVIDAAATSLEKRDLENAIAEIETLDEDMRAPFDGWLKAAKDRHTLDEGLDELRLTLMNTGR